jgi:hypothetical protein
MQKRSAEANLFSLKSLGQALIDSVEYKLLKDKVNA